MRNFRCAVVAIAVLVFTSACTRAEVDIDVPEIGATILSCANNATHRQPQGALLNNMWNQRSAGKGAWMQCLQARQRDGRAEYGWFWKWPSRDGIYAYPEILVGRSPWRGDPTNDIRFPRTVADTRALRIEYEVESRSRGKNNLAAELWLTDSPLVPGVADSQSIRVELMIWTDASAGVVSDKEKPAGVIEIDGEKWRVFVKQNWGDASGVSANNWVLISYHALNPTTHASYDARKFIDDAMSRGVVKPSYVIAGIELGNEIISGSGSTWIRKFDVSVD